VAQKGRSREEVKLNGTHLWTCRLTVRTRSLLGKLITVAEMRSAEVCKKSKENGERNNEDTA